MQCLASHAQDTISGVGTIPKPSRIQSTISMLLAIQNILSQREDPCLVCGNEEFRGGSISYLFSVTAQTQNPYNYFPALQIESNSSFVATFFQGIKPPWAISGGLAQTISK